MSIDSWAASRKKVPIVLSRFHTKRRTGARCHARPSFGVTPTSLDFCCCFFFGKKKLGGFFFFFENSVSYQKKGRRGPARPSFFWYDNDSGHWGPFHVTPPRSRYCIKTESDNSGLFDSVGITIGSLYINGDIDMFSNFFSIILK